MKRTALTALLIGSFFLTQASPDEMNTTMSNVKQYATLLLKALDDVLTPDLYGPHEDSQEDNPAHLSWEQMCSVATCFKNFVWQTVKPREYGWNPQEFIKHNR